MLYTLTPNDVRAADALVAPVPPLANGNVPVTPGRGDAVNTPAALVDARFTNNDGLAVTPVPPLATGNVPDVMLAAL